MDNSSRKASDILLELESSVKQLTGVIHAQDLNIRILSNKLSLLIEQMKVLPQPPLMDTNQYMVSTDSPPTTQIKISNDRLPMMENPQGFRRTSRPETNAGNRQQAQPHVPQQQHQNKISIQDPSPPDMSQFQKTPPPAIEELPQFKAFEALSPQAEMTGKVAVTQRITENNGKSVFLAEVEIYDKDGQVFKTRTNGVGKWQASLPIGNYKVRIAKRESVTKQKIEKFQNITVDGRVSQLILDQIIIDK